MTGVDNYEYSANDLGKYPLLRTSEDVPETVRERCVWPPDAPWPARKDELLVVEAVMQTCAVGYGGHYDEVLEGDTEGEVLRALADYLAPKYELGWQRAYDLLEQIREEYTTRLRLSMFEAEAKWKSQGFIVERPQGLDQCPICGAQIKDDGESDRPGCEAPDGQRWCVDHAMDALAAYRTQPGTSL